MMNTDSVIKKNRDEIERMMIKGAIEYFEFSKDIKKLNRFFDIKLVAVFTGCQKIEADEFILYLSDKKKYEKYIENKRKNVEKMIKKAFNIPNNITKISFEQLLNEFEKRYDTALLGVLKIKKNSDDILASDLFILACLMFLVDEVVEGKNIEFNIIDIMSKQKNADKINEIVKKKEKEDEKYEKNH